MRAAARIAEARLHRRREAERGGAVGGGGGGGGGALSVVEKFDRDAEGE